MNPTPITGAAAVALAAELSALADLREWEPIGRRVEAVISALRGADGITERDVCDLRAAAARWTRLDSRVREFYAHFAPTDRLASRVLWRLLFDSSRDALPGASLGYLRRLWVDHFGESPIVEIFPRLSPR